ncbi:MAG: hypothetical protein M0C28_41340 [Candidatus Moduliflexus flocculans]|nr:hypothetical protein [Candidatus Moduliflexus flocculans]
MMENEDSGFILCYKIKKCTPMCPIIIAYRGRFAETGISFGFDTRRKSAGSGSRPTAFLKKGSVPDQLRDD